MPTRRPPQGFSTENQDRQVMVRSAVEPRRVIYGEVGGLSGPLVFAHVSRDTSASQRTELHNIGFQPASFYQAAVTAHFEGNWHSTVAVYIVTISDEPGGFQETVAELTEVVSSPGANEYSVGNGVYQFHSSREGQHVKIVYRAGFTVVNSFFHLVVPLAGHQVQEIGDVALGSDVITSSMLDSDGNVVSGKYAHHVRLKKYLGTTDQEADPDLIAESGGKWTAAHRGRGVAYLYVRLRRNADLFPNGVPPIRATVKGALLYDPRTGLTAWSDNWALVVYDYLTKSYGLGCEASEINTTALNAAANVSDEAVEIDALGTEQARYTANGTISLDERPLDVLKRLVTTGAGGAIYSVSTWDVYAGAYSAPASSLTVSDLRGPISGRADVERRELFNGVRGTFTDPERDWQETSFPPVKNPTYVADDNGEEIDRDLDLAFVTDRMRAQRLAKIYLERARQATVCQWPGKPKLFGINTWETVNVTVAALGWSPKVFRVTGWKWQPGGGVDLALQEEAAAIYDWNFGEATTYDVAPNTSLPNTGAVAPAGAPVVTEEIVETTGERKVAVKVTISATASPDAYADRYQFEYKRASDTQWTVLPLVTVPNTDLYDIESGSYNVRVAVLTPFGRRSVYSQSTFEVTGLTAAPAAPTGLSIQAGGGTARLKLDEHPELDVRRGGRILVRFCHEGVVPSWESAFSIGELRGWPGDATQIDLPLKPGTYLVKAEDSTGHESEAWAEIATKQASVLEFTSLGTLIFDNAFEGTYSGAAVNEGLLTLGGVGLFDDIPDFDAVTDLDGYGGITGDGTCTFTTGLDLGSVGNVRLTSHIEGGVNNLLDQIDDRTGDVDDWIDWDGASFGGSAADAWLEVRETDDDPAGAPGWSEWKRLDAGEFEARAFQFRARLQSADPSYRPEVSVLRVIAEEVL